MSPVTRPLLSLFALSMSLAACGGSDPAPAPAPTAAPAPVEGSGSGPTTDVPDSGSGATPAPSPEPAPAPAPAGPSYSAAQLEIIDAIETEVATVTTRPLDPATEIPVWLAQFAASQATLPVYEWRRTMRRKAIVEADQAGWPAAASRAGLMDSGARATAVDCTLTTAGQTPQAFADRYWIVDDKVQSEVGPVPRGAGVQMDGGQPDSPHAPTYSLTRTGDTWLWRALGGVENTLSELRFDLQGRILSDLQVNPLRSISCQPASAPAVVEPDPKPAGFSDEQWAVATVVLGQVARITSHELDANSQLPGWVGHFLPLRDSLLPYEWRREMRRVAVVDSTSFNWPAAPTRADYLANGARVSSLLCLYTGPGTPGTYQRVAYWIFDNKFFNDVSLPGSSGPVGTEIIAVQPIEPFSPQFKLARDGDTYTWTVSGGPVPGSTKLRFALDGAVLSYYRSDRGGNIDCR